jgi:hypothetical protein
MIESLQDWQRHSLTRVKERDPATCEHENVKTSREHLLQEARKCNQHKSRDEETTAVL